MHGLKYFPSILFMHFSLSLLWHFCDIFIELLPFKKLFWLGALKKIVISIRCAAAATMTLIYFDIVQPMSFQYYLLYSA